MSLFTGIFFYYITSSKVPLIGLNEHTVHQPCQQFARMCISDALKPGYITLDHGIMAAHLVLPERTVLYRMLYHYFDCFLAEYENRFEKQHSSPRPNISHDLHFDQKESFVRFWALLSFPAPSLPTRGDFRWSLTSYFVVVYVSSRWLQGKMRTTMFTQTANRIFAAWRNSDRCYEIIAAASMTNRP